LFQFNVGEAVNFATYDWLKFGVEAEERYRLVARNSVFSHQRLLFTLLHHKKQVDPQFHPEYVQAHADFNSPFPAYMYIQ
jgi:hypothetical protein